MDAAATRCLLSRTSTSNISVGLQHKQSKLDLLDSKTLTSFPLPNINENATNHCNNERVSSEGTVESWTSSTTSFHIPKRWRSSILLGDYKKFNKNSNGTKADINSPTLQSRTASSIQTIDSMGNNILINSSERIKYSMTDSVISRNFMGSSKMTTPPSSLDFESTFYDYRLVLEQSEKKDDEACGVDMKDSKNGDTMTKTGCSATIENSKITDMYIQSLYRELVQKDESRQQIQCMVCDMPVFEDDDYFNKVLDFQGVVCENCLRNRESVPEDVREIDLDAGDEKSINSSSPADLYSSMDDTNHTIQLHLDTTIQSDEDTTEYGIYGNIDFFRNDNTENRNHFYGREKAGEDNFGRIIRQLRRIERTDLRIRQSIADLRSRSEQASEYDSIWSSVKRRFVNSGH